MIKSSDKVKYEIFDTKKAQYLCYEIFLENFFSENKEKIKKISLLNKNGKVLKSLKDVIGTFIIPKNKPKYWLENEFFYLELITNLKNEKIVINKLKEKIVPPDFKNFAYYYSPDYQKLNFSFDVFLGNDQNNEPFKLIENIILIDQNNEKLFSYETKDLSENKRLTLTFPLSKEKRKYKKIKLITRTTYSNSAILEKNIVNPIIFF